MINGMLDFGDDDGISGFVGPGLGVARVRRFDLRPEANNGVFLDGTDESFAWQVFAGARMPVAENVDISLKYRYFSAMSGDFEPPAGGNQRLSGGFSSHSVLIGIAFNFGQSPH